MFPIKHEHCSFTNDAHKNSPKRNGMEVNVFSLLLEAKLRSTKSAKEILIQYLADNLQVHFFHRLRKNGALKSIFNDPDQSIIDCQQSSIANLVFYIFFVKFVTFASCNALAFNKFSVNLLSFVTGKIASQAG